MKQRNGRIVVVIVACLACFPPSSVSADPPRQAATITVGDSLAQVKASLKAAQVPFGKGGFAFARVKDEGHLGCWIDENSTSAAIHYSQSRQVVTGLSVVFFPARMHTKLSQTWLSAESIRFESDGSYRIHFKAPARKKLPVHQRTSRSPGPKP